MTFDYKQQTVYLVLTGSRAYGTHTEESDYDYRGVAFDTLESKLGFRSPFEQAVDNDGSWLWKIFSNYNVKDNSDVSIFELGKFVQLALKNNPNIIEILFSDPSSVLYCHPAFQKLLEIKEDFLSIRAKGAFSGYAFDQLNKIKLHRKWLLDPPKAPPTRKEFGLPQYNIISLDEMGAAEAYLKQCLEDFFPYQEDLPEHTRIEMRNHMFRSLKLAWLSLNQTPYPVGNGKQFLHLDDARFQFAARIQGYDENFLQLLHLEKQYRNAIKNWDDYRRHLKQRNPKRLELELKYSYDPKHASHLVRLVRMCREILTLGTVFVKRPDAEELQAIRNGAWTYEQLIEYAEKENQELEKLARISKLPAMPPIEKIQNLVVEMGKEFYFTKDTKNVF